MATRKCKNGHIYDASVYGDNCPFCPSNHTVANPRVAETAETRATAWNVPTTSPTPEPVAGGGHTVIRKVGAPAAPAAPATPAAPGVAPAATPAAPVESEGPRMVGLLVSYSGKADGEVFKLFEGKNTIGRGAECSISFPNDNSMSREHFFIQYIAAKGVFRAEDRGTSNGSFVNGDVYVLGDVIELKSGDVIVLGATKLLFLEIPTF